MTLDEAAARYRQATRNLHMARDAATATRRLHHDSKATAREWADANMRAIAEWAQDAPHHDWCRSLTSGTEYRSDPCSCGRDEVMSRG